MLGVHCILFTPLKFHKKVFKLPQIMSLPCLKRSAPTILGISFLHLILGHKTLCCLGPSCVSLQNCSKHTDLPAPQCCFCQPAVRAPVHRAPSAWHPSTVLCVVTFLNLELSRLHTPQRNSPGPSDTSHFHSLKSLTTLFVSLMASVSAFLLCCSVCPWECKLHGGRAEALSVMLGGWAGALPVLHHCTTSS